MRSKSTRHGARSVNAGPRLGLLVCMALSTAGCGVNPRLVGGGGVTRGDATEEPSATIFYRVECTRCMIRFTTGPLGVGGVESKGVWSRTVRVPRRVASVTLEATPIDAEDFVEHASIRVDGRIGAQKTNDPETSRGAEVKISAVVR